MKADIIAGWKEPEERIGLLSSSHVHGKEVVSVEMDPMWMKENGDLFLDPDLSSRENNMFHRINRCLDFCQILVLTAGEDAC